MFYTSPLDKLQHHHQYKELIQHTLDRRFSSSIKVGLRCRSPLVSHMSIASLGSNSLMSFERSITVIKSFIESDLQSLFIVLNALSYSAVDAKNKIYKNEDILLSV